MPQWRITAAKLVFDPFPNLEEAMEAARAAQKNLTEWIEAGRAVRTLRKPGMLRGPLSRTHRQPRQNRILVRPARLNAPHPI
jgi:hypothetical protein